MIFALDVDDVCWIPARASGRPEPNWDASKPEASPITGGASGRHPRWLCCFKFWDSEERAEERANRSLAALTEQNTRLNASLKTRKNDLQKKLEEFDAMRM